MSAITFLASSTKFSTFHSSNGIHNLVKADKYWIEELNGLFTMPYVYEVITGIEIKSFLKYLDLNMEFGDVLEIYYVPNQHALKECIRRMLLNPEPIEVNISKLEYKTNYGTYQLDHKCWKDELTHKNWITEFGITTFVKY